MKRLLLIISIPLYIIDFFSKDWAANHFILNENETQYMSGIFTLHHTANTGVAFGLFNGTEYANIIFTFISCSALALFYILYQRREVFIGHTGKCALCLLVSGVLGNLTDRFKYGYVVDFLKFDFGFWPFHPWPSFNVADSCVVVAACLIFISGLLHPQKTTQPK
jgi:signal peptidase II